MTIDKLQNGSDLTLKIGGRLDTATAPRLEAAMEPGLDGVTDLTLDCEALEYVSSAGLRVILKAQKRMNAQGSMKLVHVSDAIMEIFDITGFVDILTIE